MADWRDEKDRFDVVLIELGPRKISVIKLVRETLGIDLAQAKDFVEQLPRTVKADLSREEADSLRDKLERAEALVQLRRRPGADDDR